MTSRTMQIPDLTAHDDPHEAERRARIALSHAAPPGDATIARLLRDRTATDVLTRLTGTGEATIDADALRHALTVAERPGHRVLIPGDPEWPTEVTDLRGTAPLTLWTAGDTSLLSDGWSRRVTVTGARAASAYGMQVAADIATGLTESGRVIVTGAAYGIDAAATRAALAAGGPTVAVVASGIDRPYPTAHADLLRRVTETGVVVSETPPGIAPSRTAFLQRARLLAALTRTVVIVEASARSSALGVAHHGLALRRTVTAVPGPVTSITSAGCHQLIQAGETHLVTSAEDITALTDPDTE